MAEVKVQAIIDADISDVLTEQARALDISKGEYAGRILTRFI